MDRAMAANTMAIVFALVAAFAGGRYCWKALTHRIAPRLATWLIFLVASALSLASYLAHAHTHASFAASIANRFDVVEVGAIVVLHLYFSEARQGTVAAWKVRSLVPRFRGAYRRPVDQDRLKFLGVHSLADTHVRRLFGRHCNICSK